MSIQVKSKYLFLASLIAIIGIFFGGWYIGATKDKNALNTTIETQKKELQRMTIELCDKEYYVTSVEQELATERELRKQDIFEKKELKALNLAKTAEINRLKLRIDTLLEDVNHNGTIITIHDTITLQPKDALLLPFEFQKQDEWLTLKGKFDPQGKLGIDLSMAMDVNAVSGIDKKTKKSTIAIYSDNPYIKTIGIASYKTDVQIPKRYGLGISMGYAVCRNGLSPFIGIGLNYSLIRF